MDPTDMFETIRSELLKVVMPGVGRREIGLESDLIADLGVDSLKFVELTVGLEAALGLAEFPMQSWIDDRVGRDEALTVGALLVACERLACARPSAAGEVDA